MLKHNGVRLNYTVVKNSHCSRIIPNQKSTTWVAEELPATNNWKLCNLLRAVAPSMRKACIPMFNIRVNMNKTLSTPTWALYILLKFSRECMACCTPSLADPRSRNYQNTTLINVAIYCLLVPDCLISLTCSH